MENQCNLDDYLVKMVESLPNFQSRAREEGIREGRKQVIEELKAFLNTMEKEIYDKL